MMSFDTLGLSGSILDALTNKGYKTPTPIQQKAIPATLAGDDILAAAQTGTGKTAGFTLPMLELLAKGKPATKRQVRSLVLAPTRELAAQVGENVAIYGKGSGLTSAVVFGGVKIPRQIKRLSTGCDILVATPGRLLDLYNQGALTFDQLEIFVLDEADRMLDMGFIHDIRKIIALLPKRRQNLMFSATFSPSIRTLAKTILNKPVEISVATANSAATTVRQWICPVDKKRKPELLHQLINDYQWKQMLVFMRTKHSANKLTRFLEAKGLKAAAIHGNKSQAARTKALTGFKNGQVDILVATDIAARGLDIDQLPQVVNFDLPQVAEDYVHRIGRTGRAGATGEAVSLVSADEFDMLTEIERLLKKQLERKLIDGFEPLHDLPASKSAEELQSSKPARKTQSRKPTTNKNKPPRSRRSNSNKPRRSGNQANSTKSRSSNRKNGGTKKTSSTSGNKQR